VNQASTSDIACFEKTQVIRTSENKKEPF